MRKPTMWFPYRSDTTEPRHEKTNNVVSVQIRHKPSRVMSKPTMWFPYRSNSNRAVQAQKMARGWKFWIWKIKKLNYPCRKQSYWLAFSQLLRSGICAFVSDAKCCFPMARLIYMKLKFISITIFCVHLSR